MFLTVGLGILTLLYKSQQSAYLKQCIAEGRSTDNCSLLDKLVSDFTNTNPLWIIAIVICSLLAHLVRGLRWQQLIERLGYKTRTINAFGSVVIGFFTNLGLPRAGEFVRATTMSRYENIPFEKLFGTVVVDRIVDMLTFILIVTGCLALEFDRLSSPIMSLMNDNGGGNNLIYWLMGLGVLGLIFLYFILKSNSTNFLVVKIQSIIKGIWEGILTIRSLERPFLFVLYTFSIWVLYLIMLWVCLPAFGPTSGLGLRAAIVIFTMGAVGFIVPSPGGMGTYHYFVIQALILYGVTEADGFSFANIAYFSGQIFSNVIFGILFLILLPIINRNYKPESNEPIIQ